MTIHKTKQIDYSTFFHFFVYQEYEIDVVVSEKETVTAFIKSPFFTYSFNHPEHCCGPFDNSKMEVSQFKIIPSDEILKNCADFIAKVKHFSDFFPNFSEKANDEDKQALDIIAEKSTEIIINNLPKCLSLYTIAYFKEYTDNKILIEAENGLSTDILHEFYGIFEYYKILISVKDNLIQTYYFLVD